MAGWDGSMSGIGKNGTGIAEPIIPQGNLGSRGFGYTKAPATQPGSMNGKNKIPEDRLKSVSVQNRDKKVCLKQNSLNFFLT